MTGKCGCVRGMASLGKILNHILPRPSAVPRSVNQYKRSTHSAFSLVFLGTSHTDQRPLRIQQPLRITVIDQFAFRWGTVELFDEFGRYIVATKRVVGAIEHLLSPDRLVATFKRLDAVTNGVDIEPMQIMLDGKPQNG